MSLSLDANVFIDVLHDRYGVRRRYDIEIAAGLAMHVSTIVLHELMLGAFSANARSGELSQLNRLLARVHIAEFTEHDALQTSRVQNQLAHNDRLTAYDALIAGQALNRGWTLVSSDAAFSRVPGLAVENWRTP